MLSNQRADLGRPPPGFNHIQRYWHKTHQCVAARILPGEYYVTPENELITTVLGSCISACIRDRKLGIGGMNHFMLPAGSSEALDAQDPNEPVSLATRYGNFAMEHMINDILKQGGKKQNLEAKVFGGGRILHKLSDVGLRNIRFVHEYLATEGIPLLSDDVGDIHPRKVVYFPATGRALVKRLRHMHNDTLVRREDDYRKRIRQEPEQGDIELF